MASAGEAVKRLTEGNRRFVDGRMEHPRCTAARRASVVKAQEPFAAILCCSDSRVPPEIIFDAGIGDLFVVRLAGNVPDDCALASLEYAVAHLHVSLVVVLGHTGCGAIQAALADSVKTFVKTSVKTEGYFPYIVKAIKPAIAAAGKNDTDAVARIHAIKAAEQLRKLKPVLHKLVMAGQLQIIAALYDLKTGKAGFLSGRI